MEVSKKYSQLLLWKITKIRFITAFEITITIVEATKGQKLLKLHYNFHSQTIKTTLLVQKPSLSYVWILMYLNYFNNIVYRLQSYQLKSFDKLIKSKSKPKVRYNYLMFSPTIFLNQ